LPIGIATAILLEEYQPKNRLGRFFYGIIQLNITNLAGVPSVVYGILGLTAFVSMFGLFAVQDDASHYEIGATYYDQFFSEGERSILVPVDHANSAQTQVTDQMVALDVDLNPVKPFIFDPGSTYPSDEQLPYALATDSEPGRITKKAWYYFSLPLGRGVLTGALTLMLVVLPVIIISAQESLRAVPASLRAGALGLGATPWQVVWNVTLPSAIPGIMTGSILAMSRAIGETAPILIIAGIVYISRAPEHLMDDFTVMPLQVYNWIGRPQPEFQGIAAAGIILLLIILLSFNAVAVMIRHKLQKPLS
jgi:phosphate transport system permease protein